MSNYCIEKEYEFNPTCDKEVSFNLRALTASQRDECIQQRFIGGEVELLFNRTKIFKYGVISIDNLTVNKKEIKTAKEFLENVIPEIYEEVINKVIDNTAKKDPKNS